MSRDQQPILSTAHRDHRPVSKQTLAANDHGKPESDRVAPSAAQRHLPHQQLQSSRGLGPVQVQRRDDRKREDIRADARDAPARGGESAYEREPDRLVRALE
ncbi:hypothetical protein PG997_013603 [Apiospora hydei]|uniref:Uncharacterized protein n=1 Tax=Apiospora hydei TaxID=1337664 RepID=A0ABR1V6L9_9PEZI